MLLPIPPRPNDSPRSHRPIHLPLASLWGLWGLVGVLGALGVLGVLGLGDPMAPAWVGAGGAGPRDRCAVWSPKKPVDLQEEREERQGDW